MTHGNMQRNSFRLRLIAVTAPQGPRPQSKMRRRYACHAERVTVISDDAGEFNKAVAGSQLARARILDWFHIAMKFEPAQNSICGEKTIDSLERESMTSEICSAKWLV